MMNIRMFEEGNMSVRWKFKDHNHIIHIDIDIAHIPLSRAQPSALCPWKSAGQMPFEE